MRAGIITFHWAANYGAVLQTYALQEALKKKGIECEIIDYFPKKYKRRLVDCFISRSYRSFRYKLTEYKKEKRINKVINKYLCLSKRYDSDVQLINDPPEYDVYISGSDQIWNPYFTLGGDSKNNYPYFLDFAIDKRKISYSSSIGSVDLPNEYWEVVIPKLKTFEQISVREESTGTLLESKGLKATVVPDPTILLSGEEYSVLTNDVKAKFVYYILQENQSTINAIKDAFLSKYDKKDVKNLYNVNIKDWLGYIKNSELVLTNSYHCVIFSILFHKDFLVVPIEGQLTEMNTRFDTLLKNLGLDNRMVKSFAEASITESMSIDWDGVESRLAEFKTSGNSFLNSLFYT